MIILNSDHQMITDHCSNLNYVWDFSSDIDQEGYSTSQKKEKYLGIAEDIGNNITYIIEIDNITVIGKK